MEGVPRFRPEPITTRDVVKLKRLSAAATESSTRRADVAQVLRLVDRIDIATPENHREHFGYVDGQSRPFIEGQGGSPAPGQGDPARAGEFVLGYVNELGTVATGPGPEGFWRNGTYVSIRRMHQQIALFRCFLAPHESDPGGAELLAAKMVGRWRSGCPVELSPDRDDPEIAADPLRNNDFSYADDPRGVRTPLGTHVRRVNPRDALDDTGTDTRLHRILRRGAAYARPALCAAT